MTIMWVKVHKCLGMTIDYSSPGKVILLIVNYIGKIIGVIPEETKGVYVTPAAHNPFDIAEDTTKMSHTNGYIFTIL